jgi:Adenovirus endoprotease
MRDELQRTTSQDNECSVINTDHSRNDGTHWTCLFIKNGTSYYFDPFGFSPTLEVINYCKEPRYYNTFPIQKFSEVICGHYCIFMLHRLNNGDDFYDICLELYH